MYWVYIIICSNGAFYVGYTTDLQMRYQEHLAGKGAKYTRSFKPVQIAQAWRISIDKSLAMKVEAYIKSQSRQQKELFIANPELIVNLFGEEGVSVEPNLVGF